MEILPLTLRGERTWKEIGHVAPIQSGLFATTLSYVPLKSRHLHASKDIYFSRCEIEREPRVIIRNFVLICPETIYFAFIFSRR